MAGIGGFLAGLGGAYARQQGYYQEYEQNQSLIDERKSDVALKQQQLGMLAQQRKTQQEVGQFVSSEMQKDNTIATDPAKSAKLYEDAAGVALRNGDFTSANTMNDLAKSKLQEAKEAATYQAQQQQLKKEAFAQSASDFGANPTADGLQDLQAKAVAAGVNPTTIPKPGTPQFAAWVNQAQMASMDAKSRAEFTEKKLEANDKLQERRQEHQDNVALRRDTMAQTGMLREAMIGIQRQNSELRAAELGLREREVKIKEDTAASGGKQGVQQQRDTAAIAGAAAEGARNLRQITNFQIGTTGSPFTGLTDHNIVDAMAKTSTNALTPDTMQMFQTAGAGLAQQVGRVETLGGGRGVNQTQINQLEKQLTPVPGDHPLTQLYKVATGAELLLTRMENTPAPRDAKMAEQWNKTIDELQKYPKPEAILAKAQGSNKKEILNLEGSYADNLNKIRASGENNSPVPSAAPAGAQQPGLPTGWSVKVK